MRKYFVLPIAFLSSFAFSAEWSYVSSGSNGDDFYVDRSYYKYDLKSKTVDMWVKSEKTSLFDKNKRYTSSKALNRYSCTGKSSKSLAYAAYNDNGSVLNQTSTPESDFKIIFPDTINESLWEVACKSNGKGLFLPQQQRMKALTRQDMEKLGISVE